MGIKLIIITHIIINLKIIPNIKKFPLKTNTELLKKYLKKKKKKAPIIKILLKNIISPHLPLPTGCKNIKLKLNKKYKMKNRYLILKVLKIDPKKKKIQKKIPKKKK
jgi:hypothetical protein